MALVRKHIGLNDTLIAIIEKLGAKWGLDFTNTLRHCVMLAAERENIPIEAPRRSRRDR